MYKDTNELVLAIAVRVKELADTTMPLLRKYADVGGEGAIAAHKHSTRGELIEDIICQEFEEEEPHVIDGN